MFEIVADQVGQHVLGAGLEQRLFLVTPRRRAVCSTLGTFNPVIGPTGRYSTTNGSWVSVLTKRVATIWTSSTWPLRNRSRAKPAIALASGNVGVSPA